MLWGFMRFILSLFLAIQLLIGCSGSNQALLNENSKRGSTEIKPG
jgi:hypothetical protein